jgi:hypothetical protein
MVIARGDSTSFYLRTPAEYRKLAADDIRAAEEAGMSADKAELAVGRTWLRLAEESETAESEKAKESPLLPGQAELSQPEGQAEQQREGATTAEPSSKPEAPVEPIDAAQILISLANLASHSRDSPD